MIKKMHSADQQKLKRINTKLVSDPSKSEYFCETLKRSISPHEGAGTSDITIRWEKLRNEISVFEAFGPQGRRNADWFAANIVKMKPVTERKRTAHLTYKENPCPDTLSALRTAHKKSKQTALQCS